MAKRSLSLDQRRAIRDRLQEFRRKHYKNQQAMNRDAGVPHNTAAAWFAKDPSTPDAVSLVGIAERKNLNLNWLLLGEGPQLRGIHGSDDVWSTLRQTLVAELISHGARADEAERTMPSEDVLFHLLMVWALEGWTTPKRPRGRAHADARARARPRTLPPSIARELERFLSGAANSPTLPHGSRKAKRAE